jgi:hypothetical protein
LFNRLTRFDFSLNVLTKRFFAWAFFQWHHLPFLAAAFAGLAVLADSLKSLAVGAPALPTFRIFSPDPAAIRAFFA